MKSEFLKEHSVKQKNRIVKYIGNDPTKFSELIRIFVEGPYRVTQRAAWPLSYVVQQHPTLVEPHLSKILSFVSKPEAPDAVKRNVVRLLQFIEIPKKVQGKTAEICFQFFSNKKEPVAIRVFAMTVLVNLSREIPELKQEIKLIIDENLPYASAAFTSRAKKMLKQLN